MTQRSWKKYVIIEILIIMIVSIGLTFYITRNICFVAEIRGNSMAPTFSDGDKCLALRLHSEKIEYGIYVAYCPELDEDICKRLIGIEGDTIEFRDGIIYRNGVRLDDSYVKYNEIYQGTFTVPKGKVFLVGDNRSDSWDSRYWDDPYLDESNLIGKLVFQLNPLWKLGIVKGCDHA